MEELLNILLMFKTLWETFFLLDLDLFDVRSTEIHFPFKQKQFLGVCTSGLSEDLEETDKIAAEVIQSRLGKASARSKMQYQDNYLWITKAGEHKLVVGSQARILYSDAQGRIALAVAINQAVKDGKLKGPVVISRDHHDVSGTDRHVFLFEKKNKIQLFL